MSVFSTEVDKFPLTGQLCTVALSSKDSSCPYKHLWTPCLSIYVCQMRGSVGALRAVAEALQEMILCGDVWASLSPLLTLIPGSLAFSGWAESPVISATELVGKLEATGSRFWAFPGSVRHG